MKQLFLSALTFGAVICVFFSPLMAEEVLEESGNAFLRHCSVVEKDYDLTSADKSNQMVCAAYVSGFVEGASAAITFGRSKGESPSSLYCTDSGMEAGQLVRVVLKYIRSHPETAHLRTFVLVTRAFQAAYPCRA
jgi:Rap1a immunity proteins